MQNLFSLNCLTGATSTRLKQLAVALVLCLIADKQMALAMPTSEPDPEIIASCWDNNEDHYANVTLNGKELIRLKESAAESTTADSSLTVTLEDKAEDIAAKLDQLVKNKKFSADKLYPVKTKEGVVLTFDAWLLLLWFQ